MTKHQREKKWRSWLSRHGEELAACGLPREVLEKESYWNHFLTYGYLTGEKKEPLIVVDDMEKIHAERLCLFLERLNHSCYTLSRLQCLLKRGRYTETDV